MPSHTFAELAQTWRPPATHASDALGPGPVAALHAVLDLPGAPPAVGDALPPLWHWLYFLSWTPHRELSVDGHATREQFLPPLPDRRRMFAGGRLSVHAPLIIGEPAERVSRVAEVRHKTGRSGELLFVTVAHELRQGGELRVTEEQDLVYLSGGYSPTAARKEPLPEALWQLTVPTDPALLFRISALTANTHRIHYDAPYATGVEGYPGLVVHGPLQALVMLELFRQHEQVVRTFAYRLHEPAFCGDELLVLGDTGWARVASDRAARHASAKVTLTR